jgi:hypothetical protein
VQADEGKQVTKGPIYAKFISTLFIIQITKLGSLAMLFIDIHYRPYPSPTLLQPLLEYERRCQNLRVTLLLRPYRPIYKATSRFLPNHAPDAHGPIMFTWYRSGLGADLGLCIGPCTACDGLLCYAGIHNVSHSWSGKNANVGNRKLDYKASA